jgi:hypothetical protein
MKSKKLISLLLTLILIIMFILTSAATAPRYRQAIPYIYDHVWDFSEGMAAIHQDGKWGFIDRTGNLVIPAIYDEIQSFSEGMAAARISDHQDGKWGFIDKAGNVVIPFIYDGAGSFSEGLAAVRVIDDRNAGKLGFIDKTGDLVIPMIYDSALSFSEGLAAVGSGGELVIEETYSYVVGNKWGFIDKAGNEIVPPRYSNVFLGGFHNGLAMVSYEWDMSGTYSYIDKTGREVVPFTNYAIYWYFQDGGADWFYIHDDLIIMQYGDYFGFADRNGDEVLPAIYERVQPFSEGLAPVFRDESWRIIDKTGREIAVLDNYDSVMPFFEGMAAVHINWKWGFIDKAGNEIIPPIYDTFGGHGPVPPKFQNGLVILSGDDYKMGILDKSGEIVVPFEYYISDGRR